MENTNNIPNEEQSSRLQQPAVMGWVAAIDELPERGIEVLGLNVHGRMVVCSWWPFTNWCEAGFRDRIKYWHPLPPPPCP